MSVPVGFWLDLRNPPGWGRPWPQFYAETLDLLAGAEDLGLGSAWLAEHHLFEDGYVPQPLTFAAALAARTQRMRIGTAILQAPLRPAIDIAEQAAVVDIISGGRLELGLGAGYAAAEFEAYGADREGRFRRLRENAADLRRIWPERISPPPVQAAAPLWIGALGPRLARFAGELGAGLLSFGLEHIDAYREGLLAGGHEAGLARYCAKASFLLADDPDRVWDLLAPRQQWVVESYGRLMAAEGAGLASFKAEVDPELLRERTGVPQQAAIDVVTPAEAIERIGPWLATAPVEHVLLPLDVAALPVEVVERHVELAAGLVGAFQVHAEQTSG